MKKKIYLAIVILGIVLIPSAEAAIQCPSVTELKQESMLDIEYTTLMINEIRFNTVTKKYGTDVDWDVQVVVKGRTDVEAIDPSFEKAKKALKSLSFFLQQDIGGHTACTYLTNDTSVMLSAVQKLA